MTTTMRRFISRAAMTLVLMLFTATTAWAESLAGYSFTTGVDQSKWITLSGNATQIVASSQNDVASSLTNIGFSFPFGDGTYTQFWVNSNGIFSFSDTPKTSYKNQFGSSDISVNQPKICGISRDLNTGKNGYIKYELTGTAPNRVLVCEFYMYYASSDENARIKWQIQLHEADAKVVMVYGDLDGPTFFQIGLSQSSSDIWTIDPSTHKATHSTEPVSTNYHVWPGAYRYYEFVLPFSVNGSGNLYTINNAAGWDVFCDYIDAGESFNGKTVKLGADITVTRMAGSNDKPFSGTFDGQGNTLTLDYGTADNPIDAQFVAPFVMTYWNTSPTFRNLTIDGHIYSTCTNATITEKNTGGLIGHLFGNVKIENCTSNVEITCPGGAGGFVGLCEHTVNFTDCLSSAVIHSAGGNNSGFVSWSRASGYEINFTGCLFNGKLLQIGENGGNNGGFIGWTGSNKKVSITNSLCAPAALANGETMANGSSATFARGWNATTTASNCYYTAALGSAQAKQARSITVGNFVTVANSGTVSNSYSTSGLTFYNTGFTYNNVLYAANEDQVSLSISNTMPAIYGFSGYSVSPADVTLTGSGNNYALTMPDADVVITATSTPVAYLDGNGTTQTCNNYILLTGTETTLAAGWYVADGNVSFDHQLSASGDVHLILKDNAVMNIGTAQSPVSNNGLYGNGHSISIYAQSKGDSKGQLKAIATGVGIFASGGNVEIYGGEVTATATGNGGEGIVAKKIGSNGGSITLKNATVTAEGAYAAIHAMNGGVTAEGCTITATGTSNGSYGIFAQGGNMEINGCKVTATANSLSIMVSGGNVEINGGEVTATTTDTYSIGIFVSGGNVIINDGKVTATSTGNSGIGIFASGGNVEIYGGEVTATATGSGGEGIFASKSGSNGGSITLKNATVTAEGVIGIHAQNGLIAESCVITATGTGGYGIYVSVGNVEINGGKVTAKATGTEGEGIFASKSGSNGGSITLTNATVTAEGAYAIHATNGLTAESCVITATGTGGYGIYATSGNVEINGGEVTATATGSPTGWYTYGGIVASNGSVSVTGATITAGGTNAVYAKNGMVFDGSTVTVSNLCFTQSGDLVIRNNSNVTSTASGDYCLENEGGSINISDSEVDAKARIHGKSGVTLTNAVVNINKESGDYAIYAVSNGITIDGSTVTTTKTIFAERGDLIIRNHSKIKVTGDADYHLYSYDNVSISDSEVEFSNQIHSDQKNVTIDGSIVKATGDGSGTIYANHGILTLGWSSPSDLIYAKSYVAYDGSVVIAEGKTFIDEDGNTYSGTIAKENDAYAIDGKTLTPYVPTEGYYLVGTMTNWGINPNYKLTENTSAQGEYMIQNVPLTSSTGIKAIHYNASTGDWTWYPGGDNNNYNISEDGIYNIYFRPDYQGGNDWHYGCIYAAKIGETVDVNVSFAPEGFATYYNGQCDVTLPAGVKARVITDSGDKLTYETIADGDDSSNNIVPAGTAVMLQTAASTDQQTKTLTLSAKAAAAYTGTNLLHGSDYQTTTTGGAKYYKMTYSKNNDNFGWYWGAANGAAFTIPGHKAWLALPTNAPAFLGLPDYETTGVTPLLSPEGEDEGASPRGGLVGVSWYTLDGRKLNGKPTQKGLYINNGKKVAIK